MSWKPWSPYSNGRDTFLCFSKLLEARFAAVAYPTAALVLRVYKERCVLAGLAVAGHCQMPWMKECSAQSSGEFRASTG